MNRIASYKDSSFDYYAVEIQHLNYNLTLILYCIQKTLIKDLIF